MTTATRHVEQATRATGLLLAFNRSGILSVADVQVAQRVSYLAGEPAAMPQLAFALVVRALRLGSVCVRIDELRSTAEASAEVDLTDDLPWPDPAQWREAILASPLVTVGPDEPGRRPLRLVEEQLYLERSWEQQEDVRTALQRRCSALQPAVDVERVATLADALFSGDGLDPGELDRQRLAAVTAARSWVTVLAGGPGTGKTTTIARLLALLCLYEGRMPRIRLAAPSGKAAARLQEAVRTEVAKMDLPEAIATGLSAVAGSTVHRLLGAIPGRRPARDASNPLSADVVVVDETSMVSLSLMAQILAAVRPDARLILVGDPDQLASIDAGAVLADMVGAAEARAERVTLPMVRLTRTWRYEGAIGVLAEAVRRGDATAAAELATTGGDELTLLPLDDDGRLSTAHLDSLRRTVLGPHLAALRAAQEGDAAAALKALSRQRVLCAHRSGPHGKDEWNRRIEGWLAEAVEGYAIGDRYVGQPLLVTRNDTDLGVSNGDTGIVVLTNAGLRAAIDLGGTPLLLAPAQLDSVETVHAMTVHKAQGSQFDAVTVVLPMLGSSLLTRQLLYTAVTRASKHVTLVAHPDALTQAVTHQALRASGLRTLL